MYTPDDAAERASDQPEPGAVPDTAPGPWRQPGDLDVAPIQPPAYVWPDRQLADESPTQAGAGPTNSHAAYKRRLAPGRRFGDAFVGIGALAFLVSILYPWYAIRIDFGALGRANTTLLAWDYWSGVIAAIAAAVALVLSVAQVLGLRDRLPLPDRVHSWFLGLVALLSTGAFIYRVSYGGATALHDVSAGPEPALFVGLAAIGAMLLGGALQRVSRPE